MIADHYTSKPWPQLGGGVEVIRAREILKEMEELLAKAKAYDEANNEPDCEIEAKKEALRTIAKQLGVEINLP